MGHENPPSAHPPAYDEHTRGAGRASSLGRRGRPAPLAHFVLPCIHYAPPSVTVKLTQVGYAMTPFGTLSSTKHLISLLVLVTAVALIQTGCYNTYFISKPQLGNLKSTVEQKASVKVIIDGCDEDAAAGAARVAPSAIVAQADGAAATDAATDAGDPVDDNIDPETGCLTVRLNTASPLRVITNDGAYHRVTPFNFAMTDSQLVSPDYDLLLPIDSVDGAEVQTFSGWKTGLFIGGAVATAVATFVVISVTAGEERGFGQN